MSAVKRDAAGRPVAAPVDRPKPPRLDMGQGSREQQQGGPTRKGSEAIAPKPDR